MKNAYRARCLDILTNTRRESMNKNYSITLSLLLIIINLSAGWAASWPEPILIKVAEGLDRPVHLTHAGDDSDRLFIVEQPGRIKIFQDNVIQQVPFLDITDRVRSGGERGLLSVTFPPAYQNKRYFYVNYTNSSGDTIVSRFRLNSDNIANPQSEEVILIVEQPFSNHNGGQLAFGPDGFLYIAMGDGGSGGDPLGSGQNTNTLLGKLLRIDVESGIHSNGKPYAIPDTNPFIETADFQPEIWALGLRNPWRFSFDRDTGDLYIADVGQNLFEEVNFQFSSSVGGENYGWNIMEGLHCFEQATCKQNGLTTPVFEYGHSEGDVSITGGLVYRGNVFPRMQGVYFFADFASGRIAGLRRDNNQWQVTVLADTELNVSSFGEDNNGQIYILDISGSIYRIEDSVKLSQLEFTGLLPQYHLGDSLHVSLQEMGASRTASATLWVAMQTPNGKLLYLTSNPSQPLSTEPQAFIKQVKAETTNHSLFNVTIPDTLTKGTYIFYAIYNETSADLTKLSFTLRSNIAQTKTTVLK